MFIEPVATILAEAIVAFQQRIRVRWGVRLFGLEVTLLPSKASETIDARLEKIEIARSSLSDALTAIDDLKHTAEQNKRDLAALIESIDRAETEKSKLHGQVETLKTLAELDSERVRKGLGLPTAVDLWRERIYGFVFGIVAAVVGALIWEGGVKPLWEKYYTVPTYQTPLSAPPDKAK
jgi:hypothetical protein